MQENLLEPTRRSNTAHSPVLPPLSLSSSKWHCEGQDFVTWGNLPLSRGNPFLPQSQTSPESLSHWAARKMQRCLLNTHTWTHTHYFQRSFKQPAQDLVVLYQSYGRLDNNYCISVAMIYHYLLLLGAGIQSSGTPPTSFTLTPSL